MTQIIVKIITKISVILQTVQGWAVAAGIFVAEYFFADHATVVWLDWLCTVAGGTIGYAAKYIISTNIQ